MAIPFIISVLAGVVAVVLLRYGFQLLVWITRKLLSAIPTRYHPADKPEDEHIQILVLGDIGRSPRMQYHAISVAKHGRFVDLIGYKETARHPELIGNPRATLYALPPQPEWIGWGTLPFFLNIPAKVTYQFWGLFRTLMYDAPAPRWIIVQNPPSIPTFHVLMLVSLIRGSKVVIDWHNYGHTILAAKGSLFKLVAIFYRLYETWLGRYLGNANLAVTDAMALELKDKYKIKSPIYTLHDRPAEGFQPITSVKERKEFLSRLAETKGDAQNIIDGAVRLIVSSTSWTIDEDFDILLSALVAYAATTEGVDASDYSPSPVLAIITGKGPQKQEFQEKIKQLGEQGHLPGIRILTAWLSNRDYASLLACADLGISLHKSSSGVDLPMKVVDMFGAGLPVAAYSAFESFGELVKEGENGCGFQDSQELSKILKRLLDMSGEEELARLKKGAIREGALRWDEEWDRVVPKIIDLEDEK